MSTSPTLTAEELRVLACLIEKASTTPDQYPLSTNALTTACNQKTSREPVVDYSAGLVDRTMQLLRDGGWARSIRGSGNRTFKHRHVVDERLGLDGRQLALVAVLALRGPQSPGELKTRTERYHPFADLDEVEGVLASLAERHPPLVRDVGRGPGQSQNRWIQLLGPSFGEDGPVTAGQPEVAGGSSLPGGPAGSGPTTAEVPAVEPGPVPDGSPADDDEVARRRARVEALERRLTDLERELGLGP